MDKIRVLETFSGYGSQSIALENIGLNHEVVAISEIDPDVIISYGAIRGDINQQPIHKTDEEIKEWLMARNIGWDFQKQKSSIPRMKKDKLYKLYNSCVQHNNLGDISKIDAATLPDHDLFTYSFPCTDVSVAGHQQGLAKGSGTRSGLLWECEKIISAKKPKYLLMENVKNLVSKKFKPDFDVWCEWLEEQGYTNYWQVLNAKDYGIPQNRERVFMVSILGEHEEFTFPKGFDNGTRLKHVLEETVEDKYYISQDKVDRLMANIEGRIDLTKGIIGTCHERNDLGFATRDRVYNAEFNSPTICATDYKDSKKILCVGNVNPSGNGQNGNVYSAEYNAPTVTVNKGEGPKVAIPCSSPDRLEKRQNGRRFKTDGEPMFTLTSQDRHGILQVENEKVVIDDTYINRSPRVYTDYCPTLRSKREGLKVMNTHAEQDSLIGVVGSMQKNAYVGNGSISSALTSAMGEGGGHVPMIIKGNENTNKVIKLEVAQTVRVRKHEVDVAALKDVLRGSKANTGLTNKIIAETLNKPVTLVEHWFRNDSGFAIPDADIWFDLKTLLNICTTEFDESITTFIEKEGVYEKANRVYLEEGVSPTLTCGAHESVIVNECLQYDGNSPIRIGNIYGEDKGTGFAGNVWSKDAVSPTLTTMQGGNRQPMTLIETCEETDCNHASIKKVGHLEYPNSTKQHQSAVVYDDAGLSPTLTATDSSHPNHVLTGGNKTYRIRKLTPKECWRLMGMKDEHFEKCVAAGVSNSQLYKQAGNSIVVDVLEHLFASIFKVNFQNTQGK